MENRDEKFELMFSKEAHQRMIDYGVKKGITKELVRHYTDAQHWFELSQEILHGYTIQPPHIALIPKDDSTEMRKVYVNSPKDRMVLSLINDVYYQLYCDRFHPNCVSYQRGIGVSNIIKKISTKIIKYEKRNKDSDLLGYKVDLSKYFDSVNRETLMDVLASITSGSVIDCIILNYYTDDRIIDENKCEVEHYKSLAQGCALSTILANLALYDIDETLSNMDIMYYRYSDDILMIGRDAEKARQKLEEMLKPKGLTLNPKKVCPIHKDEWFTFLGFKINGTKITFSDKKMIRFKRKIKELCPRINPNNRGFQKKCIKGINYFLYTAFIKSKNNFGWGEYMFNTVNVEADVKVLDEYVKDHLKSVYSGTANHTTSMHKTSNEELEALGYVSMVHLYKLYKADKEVYRAEIRRKMM